MKNIILVTLCFLATIPLKAQQVLFKPAYMPQTKYTDTKDMKMIMTMVQEANPTTAINMDMTMTSINTISTNAPDKNKAIPAIITTDTKSVKMTMNGNDMPMAAMPTTTMKIYGKYTNGIQLQIDSLAGQKMTDSIKSGIAKMVDALQNTVKFPEKPLKIGESFTQDVPFNMPMMNLGAGKGADANKVTVKMTYKLLSVADNTAVFDITEALNIDLNQDIQGQNLKMVMMGQGTGTMSYNISKQYLSTLTNTLNMDFNIDAAGQSMKGKSTVNTTDKVEMAAN